MTLQAGFQLGARYKIIKPIGFGGMATVYLAEDQVSKTYVAVKIMDSRLSTDKKFVQRFQQEANIGKRLDHPNIPKVFEWGVQDEYYYIVMEFVQGKSLRQIMRDEKVLDLSTAMELMQQILQSLSYAYGMGIKAHRDIKPDNIMIESKTQRVKIMDFGIAKMESSQLTHATMMFSANYAAPEQLLPQKFPQGVNHYTDLYALAMIFYELLSGRAPFYGESSVEVIQQQLKKKFPPIHVLCPYLPVKLQDFFKKALNPQPQTRHQTPEEMMRDLDALITKNKQRPEPVQATRVIQRPGYSSKPRQSQDKPATKKNNSVLMYSAVIAISVVLAIGSVLIVRSVTPAFRSLIARYSGDHSIEKETPPPPQPPADSSVNTRGNSVGNIVNWGLVAKQGEWIFYQNDIDDSLKLYKIRTDGSGRTKLNDDESWCLNVVGDWIYYQNGSDSLKLYKIRTDGSERTKLNEDSSHYLNVVGDWIYYCNTSDGGKLYKIRTDGSGRTKLNDDSSDYLNVVGDWIYYRNESDSYKLNKIRIDGSERTKLNEDKFYYLNVVGDWIYCRNWSDRSKLYKIRTDGSERQLVDGGT